MSGVIEICVSLSEETEEHYAYLNKNFEQLRTAHDLVFHKCYINKKLSQSVSDRHALGLHDIFSKPFGSNTLARVVADSDTVMLARGWDEMLLESMKSCDVLGTEYEDIGGFSSGNGLVQTYKRRPIVIWLAYKPEHFPVFNGVDLKHLKQQLLLINSDVLSKRYNLPIGHSLFREVAWQLPELYDKHGLRDAILKRVNVTTSEAKAVKSGCDYNEEYHLNGVPYVGHQRGSLSKAFRKHNLSKIFYDAVDAWVSKL